MIRNLLEVPFFEEWKQLYKGEMPVQKVFWQYGVLCTILLYFAAILGDVVFNGLSSILVLSLAIYLWFITNQLYKCVSNWILKLPLLIVGPVFSGMLILGLFATPMCGCGGDVNKGMNNAITREAIAMLSSAFFVNQSEKHPMVNSIGLKDLMIEMSYVTTTEEKQIDSVAGEQSFSCANAQFTCLQLHNGSILSFENQETFGGNQKNRAIKVWVDPDGSYSGRINSPEDFRGNVKAVALYLYSDGFIASDATLRPDTQSNLHHYKTDSEKVPLWLRKEESLKTQK